MGHTRPILLSLLQVFDWHLVCFYLKKQNVSSVGVQRLCQPLSVLVSMKVSVTTFPWDKLHIRKGKPTTRQHHSPFLKTASKHPTASPDFKAHTCPNCIKLGTYPTIKHRFSRCCHHHLCVGLWYI